jgi:hypothetical protein
LLVGANGLLRHIHVELRVSFAVPGRHVLRVDAEGTLEMHQRLRVTLQAIERETGADPDDRIIGVDLGGVLKGFVGLLVVSLVIERGSLAVPGVEVALVHAQGFFVSGERLRVLLLA